MAPTSEILRLAGQFRAQLIARDADSTAQVIRAYDALFQRLKPQLLSALERTGDGSPEAQFERARLRVILEQLEFETGRLSTQVDARIAANREAVIQQSAGDARRLTAEALKHKAAQPGAPVGYAAPTWKEIAPRELENLTGLLNSRPVEGILRNIAPNAVGTVRRAMLGGLADGQPPERIVRGLADVLGNSAARAATVMRTEGMRAYRETNLAAFRENGNVVKGWKWIASLSADTCAACLAMHGQEFELDDEMDSHPNCRCVQVPITATWAQLGFPDVPELPDAFGETGEQWLARQSIETQRRALGAAKFDSYSKGEIRLVDLRGHTHNKVWGGMNVEVSLSSARQSAVSRPLDSQRNWEPTMPRAQAAAWNRDSATPGPFYHSSSPNNARAIRRDGLKVESAGSASADGQSLAGRGIYVSNSRDASAVYDGELLETRVNIQKPAQIDLNAALGSEDELTLKWHNWSDEAQLRGDDPGEYARQQLELLGHDGIILKGAGADGSDYVVAFRNDQVTTIR